MLVIFSQQVWLQLLSCAIKHSDNKSITFNLENKNNANYFKDGLEIWELSSKYSKMIQWERFFHIIKYLDTYSVDLFLYYIHIFHFLVENTLSQQHNKVV